MTRSVVALVGAALLASACGKKEAVPAADARPQAAMMPDSMPKTMPVTAPSADSVRPVVKADSAAPRKAAGPLRDSAFGPKFAVDSNGKVVPLKKRP